MASDTAFKWLLDTNVISELSRLAPHENVDDWLAENIKHSVLSAVSIGELEYGVQRMQAGAKKRFLQSWLDNMILEFGARIWSVDMPTWREYGRLKRELELLGRRQDDMDILIASAAITHGLTLVTRNTQHFGDTGCKLLNPWQESPI
jgi:toxin FitB